MQLRALRMEIDLLTIHDCENEEIKKTLEALNKVRQEAIEKGDEDKANGCWRKIESIELNLLFIKAFQKIKNQKYRDAWCDLGQCEIKCNSLEKNSAEDFLIKSRTKLIKDKVLKWQSLFPYCMFLSPEFTVGYYTCSICEHKIRPRSRCEHKNGKIYNGEVCCHVAHDMEIRGLSLVTNPVQKYSVAHNDETLDFSLLKFLSDILDNAFEEWDLNWTTKKCPIEEFSNVNANDKCPCKSGNNFKNCCMLQDEVEIPHIDFILTKP